MSAYKTTATVRRPTEEEILGMVERLHYVSRDSVCDVWRYVASCLAQSAITSTSGDTPRTDTAMFTLDVAIKEKLRPDRDVVDAYFARQLERELDEAIEEAEVLTERLTQSASASATFERMVAERDQLKRALSRQIELNTPEAAQSAITPTSEPGRIPALEGTRRNADYWLAEAKHSDVEYSSAVMFFEQAINAWKNAAYAMADKAAQSATGDTAPPDLVRALTLLEKVQHHDQEITKFLDELHGVRRERCRHGVWKGDHCWECEERRS